MEKIIKEVLLEKSKALQQVKYIINCAIYMRSVTKRIYKLVKK